MLENESVAAEGGERERRASVPINATNGNQWSEAEAALCRFRRAKRGVSIVCSGGVLGLGWGWEGRDLKLGFPPTESERQTPELQMGAGIDRL